MSNHLRWLALEALRHAVNIRPTVASVVVFLDGASFCVGNYDGANGLHLRIDDLLPGEAFGEPDVLSHILRTKVRRLLEADAVTSGRELMVV